MSDMDKLESNIYASFSRVKSDILKLSGEITKISEAMTRLAEEQGDMKENIGEMAKKVAVFNSCMRQLDKVADKATSSPKTKTVVVEKIKVKKVAAEDICRFKIRQEIPYARMYLCKEHQT